MNRVRLISDTPATDRVKRKRDSAMGAKKVRDEGNRCRVCKSFGCDPAHIWDRSVSSLGEHPDNYVALCREHHRQYDSADHDGKRLDLLPYLTTAEVCKVIELAAEADTHGNGLERARKRLLPSAYESKAGLRRVA